MKKSILGFANNVWNELVDLFQTEYYKFESWHEITWDSMKDATIEEPQPKNLQVLIRVIEFYSKFPNSVMHIYADVDDAEKSQDSIGTWRFMDAEYVKKPNCIRYHIAGRIRPEYLNFMQSTDGALCDRFKILSDGRVAVIAA